MLPEALSAQIREDRERGFRPLAVIASAGTTSTGAVDPLEAIARVARANAVWFHVDAAYGGFAALTPRGRELLRGIEQADSVVLDPHKWFYCPIEAGCVLVREGRKLFETFHILPDYMRDVEREEREVNFCRLNDALIAKIIASRRLMLSSTRIGERHVLRFCVLNHRSRKEDVRAARDIILRLGGEVEKGLLAS